MRLGRHQHGSDSLDVDLRPLRLLGVRPFHPWEPFRFRHCVQQVLSLLEHPQRHPQRFLDPLGLTGKERGRRKRMSRVAPVSMHAGHVDLPENASAVRTVIGNLRTEAAHLLYVANTRSAIRASTLMSSETGLLSLFIGKFTTW
jgi:hypothetical protein